MDSLKVHGTYYGHAFTGKLVGKSYMIKNAPISVMLDKEINHFGRRKSLLLSGWADGKACSWGSCTIVEDRANIEINEEVTP